MNLHPAQPTELDERGVLRFKKNAIVELLLNDGPFDMNNLAMRHFSDEDRCQFAQLIGYSVDGFSTLSYAQEYLNPPDEKPKFSIRLDDLQFPNDDYKPMPLIGRPELIIINQGYTGMGLPVCITKDYFEPEIINNAIVMSADFLNR